MPLLADAPVAILDVIALGADALERREAQKPERRIAL
jgi:hypothetical protein